MKRKSSARVEAAQEPAASTAADLAAAAGDYLHAAGDYIHAAADRVGPLVNTATDYVTPLAHTAADRINAATVIVSPYAQSAAGRIVPLAQTAANRVGPLAQSTAERVGPLAQQAAERVTPLAQQAVDFVSPYAQQAAGLVTPYAQQATEKVGPLALAAKQRSAQAAHDAVESFGPKLDEALERVSPAVDAARGKVADDLLPRLSGALSAAAAAPVVVEATKRGKATVAAARGELSLPESQPKKSRWLRRVAVVAALAGVAALVVRKLLGSKDADWQAARPTTPYAPSQPTPGTSKNWADATDATVPPAAAPDADAPLEAVADVPETAAVAVDEIDTSLSSVDVPSDDLEGPADATATTYQGEGVYVGSEPPEGFVIKGNENSMKYHTTESGGYAETIAEVWFNSEEAAQAAGFVRAQG